jgi:hypothetical protein
MKIEVGAKLALRCWHQDSNWHARRLEFIPDSGIGEVVHIWPTKKSSPPRMDRIKLRIWVPDDPAGCERTLYRMSDSYWLEHIGIRKRTGDSYLPHVYELCEPLAPGEFESRKLGIISK